ncbi:YbaY family lipoprotein [Pararhodobacter oceanensis]|uniref:YbaY family lipoprotein n=1 Tax=Pararhodobacter oceanensis TaxID=2172121 RepID=UPI003A8DC042
MSLFRLTSCATALLAASSIAAYADEITGSASYRERIMPPPDARFVATLLDVSRADAPARVIAQSQTQEAGAPPYGFTLEYDTAEIDPLGRYAVRAALYSGAQLLFTSDTATPVLTGDAPSTVTLMMVRAEDQGTGDTPAPLGAHGLQLPASFTGTLPCASCEGITYHLDLWPDQGYHLRRIWQDEDPLIEDETGFWHADPTRTAIVLSGGSGADASQWQVQSPTQIRLLDSAGNPPASALPYELTSDATLTPGEIKGAFLGGMVSFSDGAARFEECGTGHSYPVAVEGDLPALERIYQEDHADAAAPLYVNLEGSLLLREGSAGAQELTLSIDRMVRSRDGVTCERQRANAALTNTYWRIDTLGGETLPTLPEGTREPHLILRHTEDAGAEARFSATAGCNAMMGGYEHEGTQISFGQIASTLMACQSPLDTVERDLAQMLSQVHSHRINGETLALYDAAGEIIGVMTAVYLR